MMRNTLQRGGSPEDVSLTELLARCRHHIFDLARAEGSLSEADRSQIAEYSAALREYSNALRQYSAALQENADAARSYSLALRQYSDALSAHIASVREDCRQAFRGRRELVIGRNVCPKPGHNPNAGP